MSRYLRYPPLVRCALLLASKPTLEEFIECFAMNQWNTMTHLAKFPNLAYFEALWPKIERAHFTIDACHIIIKYDCLELFEALYARVPKIEIIYLVSARTCPRIMAAHKTRMLADLDINSFTRGIPHLAAYVEDPRQYFVRQFFLPIPSTNALAELLYLKRFDVLDALVSRGYEMNPFVWFDAFFMRNSEALDWLGAKNISFTQSIEMASVDIDTLGTIDVEWFKWSKRNGAQKIVYVGNLRTIEERAIISEYGVEYQYTPAQIHPDLYELYQINLLEMSHEMIGEAIVVQSVGGVEYARIAREKGFPINAEAIYAALGENAESCEDCGSLRSEFVKHTAKYFPLTDVDAKIAALIESGAEPHTLTDLVLAYRPE